MKIVPLISTGFYLTAVVLGITSLFSYWSSTTSNDIHNVYTISDLGLDKAHLSLSSLLPPSFRKLVGAGSGGYIDLDHDNARNLFKLAGDYKSDKHANLLAASRTMLLCTIVSHAGALVMSTMQSFKFPFYSKIWAIVPLIASIASLVFGILSLSFFGTVHNSLRNSSLYEAKYSTGFTCALLSTIFGALPMITSIVDLSLPNRLRGAGGPATPSSLANLAQTITGAPSRVSSKAVNEAAPAVGTAEGSSGREEVPSKVTQRRGTGEPHNVYDVQHAK